MEAQNPTTSRRINPITEHEKITQITAYATIRRSNFVLFAKNGYICALYETHSGNE
jgi:hypothetical protein